METNSVKCPECGKDIPFEPKEGDATKLVAYHTCRPDGIRRAMVETDAPGSAPRKGLFTNKPDNKE